jgi:4-hydroxythreonine-4-phosphate dehydrogenase
MQQSSGKLHVSFVTTHIPLREVVSQISQERIVANFKLLHQGLIEEGIDAPRIAMAAINPHAGENGYMGNEDIETTTPAIIQLQNEGFQVEGPFPPDTLFIPEIRNQFDGIVCMYHDQGHIPFKMIAFDKGVNSTLGLPIIRTSVDHGTAFNLAWQGKANEESLIQAIKLATKKSLIKARKFS